MIYALIIVAAILIALIYSLFLSKRAPNSTIDWWNSLISTFLSVLLGVVVGIWLFEYTAFKTDESNRTRYCNLLSSEFSDTYRILSSGKHMNIRINENDYSVLITYIQPIVVEDAARSGLFEQTITENLLHLARKMKMFNIKTQYVLAKMSAGQPINEVNFEANMRNAFENIEETKESVIASIRLLSKQLKIELSDSIKQNN